MVIDKTKKNDDTCAKLNKTRKKYGCWKLWWKKRRQIKWKNFSTPSWFPHHPLFRQLLISSFSLQSFDPPNPFFPNAIRLSPSQSKTIYSEVFLHGNQKRKNCTVEPSKKNCIGKTIETRQNVIWLCRRWNVVETLVAPDTATCFTKLRPTLRRFRRRKSPRLTSSEHKETQMRKLNRKKCVINTFLLPHLRSTQYSLSLKTRKNIK